LSLSVNANNRVTNTGYFYDASGNVFGDWARGPAFAFFSGGWRSQPVGAAALCAFTGKGCGSFRV